MINVTKLLCADEQPASTPRNGDREAASKPVVVWNITRRNTVDHLSASDDCNHPGELTLAECRSVIDDFSEYGVTTVVLSGGEPMEHPHFFEIARYAVSRGLPTTVSTDGMRITARGARRLSDLGISYVGISLNGIGKTHDRSCGRSGAFKKVVQALRNCRASGQEAGVRLTLTRQTADQLSEILEFIEQENISRVCFHHSVSIGPGSELNAPPHAVTRRCLEQIAATALRWNASGHKREVFTDDQPADGAFFWMLAQRRIPGRAPDIWRFLASNAAAVQGSVSGVPSIDSHGWVHPDQYRESYRLGNVRERPFSEIWKHAQDDLLGLRQRIPRLHGRCATCRFLSVCGGGFRVRALQRYGDPSAEDPGCYLSADQIAGVPPYTVTKRTEACSAGVDSRQRDLTHSAASGDALFRPHPSAPPGSSSGELEASDCRETVPGRGAAFRSEAIVYSLRGTRLFAGLADHDLREIAKIVTVKTIDRGEYVHRTGDRALGFFIVRTGIINVHRAAKNGREQVIHLYRASESFSEGAVARDCYAADARAVVKSELLFVPKEEFIPMLRHSSDLALRMIEVMDQKMRALISSLESLTLKDSKTRLMHWLLLRCPDLAAHTPVSIDLGMTKGVLASELGTRQETLSRMLARLRAEGYLSVQRRIITIRDPLAFRSAFESHLGEPAAKLKAA